MEKQFFCRNLQSIRSRVLLYTELFDLSVRLKILLLQLRIYNRKHLKMSYPANIKSYSLMEN